MRFIVLPYSSSLRFMAMALLSSKTTNPSFFSSRSRLNIPIDFLLFNYTWWRNDMYFLIYWLDSSSSNRDAFIRLPTLKSHLHNLGSSVVYEFRLALTFYRQ